MDNNDYVNGLGFCCNPAGETTGSLTGKMTAKNDNGELQQFYYHPDHLGSSSYISNLDGEVVQHIEYVPFGEVFLEEKNAKWNTPYLFTSKELDRETGMYYFGARYQDPKLGIFISVDPLAEKFVGWSSYTYTLNNPVRFIDSSGMEPEPPINLFGTKDGPTFHNVPKNFNYKVGDGKFYVFAHSHSGGIQYQDKDGVTKLAQNAKEVNTVLASRSEEWAKAMKDGKPVTLTLYSCNAASEEYITHDGRKVARENTIAEKISKEYPNVTVVAADGYVIYGKDKDNKPAIKGVQNHKDDGGLITIKNGKKIAKKQEAYISPNETKVLPKKKLKDEN